jgi:hypothetical protein
MKKTRAIASVLLGAAALAPIVGRYRFKAQVSAEVRHLLSNAVTSVGPDQLAARRETLPEPVLRYLRFAVPDSSPAIRTARLTHDGSFRMAPDQNWWPIEGEQYFSAATPGFVWNARVRPMPLLWIDARDALLSDRGNMLVKLFSAVTMADASGSEIDQGASLRWLAECAWFPYAFVGNTVQWAPIDSHSARATLRYEGPPASALVEVDDEGRLIRLTAERYRDIGGGKSALTRWRGSYREYREFGGFRVPTSVEVAWDLDTGSFSYARFHVTTLQYNVSAELI